MRSSEIRFNNSACFGYSAVTIIKRGNVSIELEYRSKGNYIFIHDLAKSFADFKIVYFNRFMRMDRGPKHFFHSVLYCIEEEIAKILESYKVPNFEPIITLFNDVKSDEEYKD